MTTLPPKPTIFRLNLLGDVMLGRLIDQLFPAHVHEPSEARVVSNIRSQAQYARLASYGPRSPWGNALPLLHEADLTLINLETAATTHNTKVRSQFSPTLFLFLPVLIHVVSTSDLPPQSPNAILYHANGSKC